MLDAHIHSTFSDGKLDPADIAAAGSRKGILTGISDHAGTMYPLNNNSEILKYLSQLDDYPVRRGIELNINENFPLSDAVKEKLDYTIGGVHFEGEGLLGLPDITTPDPDNFVEEITGLLIRAISEKRINILSHPTCLPRSLMDKSEELFDDRRSALIISSSIEHNVFLEINSLFEVPRGKFMRKAVKMGARFSLGSDGHQAEDVCKLDYPLQIIKEFNIPEEDIFFHA